MRCPFFDPHRAEHQQRRIDGGEIVALPCEASNASSRSSQRSESARNRKLRSNEPPTVRRAIRSPQGPVKRSVEEKRQRRHSMFLPPAAAQLEEGPAMRPLPQQIRQHHDPGEQRSQVDPRTQQRIAPRRGEQAHAQRHHIECDQVLGVEAEPRDGAECQPPALVAGLFQPHQHPPEPEPGQRLKHIGREQHALDEEDRSQQYTCASKPLCEAAAARNARKLGGQRYGCRHHERREQAEAPEEIAEHCMRPRREQRHDDRLIDIAPIGPVAADDEVELITKEAVVPVGQCVQHQARNCKQQRRSRPNRFDFCRHGTAPPIAHPKSSSINRTLKATWVSVRRPVHDGLAPWRSPSTSRATMRRAYAGPASLAAIQRLPTAALNEHSG